MAQAVLDRIEVEPIKEAFGATVRLAKADFLDPQVGARCRELLERYGVLVFPEADLSDEEQLAFTDNMGARASFTSTVQNQGTSADVYQVTLDPEINDQPEYVQGTFFWHMDGLPIKAPPPLATVLSARRIAPAGGQTEFASTYAAYEGLPDADKAEIAGLRATHSVTAGIRMVIEDPSQEELDMWAAMPTNEHPLVWTHESGRKSLVIGYTADRVAGMTLAEGRALLARLLEWTAQPAYTYRHHWRKGDLVVWDNTGALHRVIPYDKSSGRMMHRTSIAGTEEVR